MKKTHYRNIGFPKTGTDFMFTQLMRNPWLDGKVNEWMKEYKGNSLEEYRQTYKNFDLSVNLNPHIFMVSDGDDHFTSPKNIDQHTTHITLCLRNPYEVLNSMYNMLIRVPRHQTLYGKEIKREEWLDVDGHQVKTYADMRKLFSDWEVCKVPVKYIFYDDLLNDSKQFIYDLCDYIGVPRFFDKSITRTNRTVMKDPLTFDKKETIDYINDNISVIEQNTGRDLSHWKR